MSISANVTVENLCTVSETHLVNTKGVPVSRAQILQSIPMYLVGCLMLSSTESCLPVQFDDLIRGDISLEQVIWYFILFGRNYLVGILRSKSKGLPEVLMFWFSGMSWYSGLGRYICAVICYNGQWIRWESDWWESVGGIGSFWRQWSSHKDLVWKIPKSEFKYTMKVPRR